MARDLKTEPFEIPDLPVLTEPELTFARMVFQGSTATDAYKEAYPERVAKWHKSTVWAEASRLKGNDTIRTWLQVMCMNGLHTTLPSLEQHVANLDEIKGLALAAGNYGAAQGCEVAIGKVTGHYIDKIQSPKAALDLIAALMKLDNLELRAQLAAQYGVTALLQDDKPATTH